MTNKLPEVGKRYKSLMDNHTIRVVELESPESGYFKHSIEGEFGKVYFAPNRFINYFEELPSEIKETPKLQKDEELSKEMQEALNKINEIRVKREGYKEGWDECFETIKQTMSQKDDEVQVVIEGLRGEIKLTKQILINENCTYINPFFLIKKAERVIDVLDPRNKQDCESEIDGKVQVVCSNIFANSYKKSRDLDFKITMPEEKPRGNRQDGWLKPGIKIPERPTWCGSDPAKAGSDQTVEWHHKPKSIWKSVEEFKDCEVGGVAIAQFDDMSHEIILASCNNKHKYYFYNYKNRLSEALGDEINENQIARITLLTDFITQIDSLEERIKKLEGK